MFGKVRKFCLVKVEDFVCKGGGLCVCLGEFVW